MEQVMTRIVVDPVILEKMCQLREPLEISDASGQVLGHFLPQHDAERYRRTRIPFDEEQLAAFEQEPGGRPLADILSDLRKS
jgi:hypothetical protein